MMTLAELCERRSFCSRKTLKMLRRASKNVVQSADQRRPILIGVDLARGDQEQVVEAGAGEEARNRDAGEDALGGEGLDYLGGGARQPQRELVEEALVEDLDAAHAAQRFGEL